MLRKIRRRTEPRVEFRESTGKVCDARCRGNELIDRKRERALLSGWKLA